MNGFVRIREFEESYTSTEKLIAKYILEHGNEILNYSHKHWGRRQILLPQLLLGFLKKLVLKVLVIQK